MEKQVKLSEEIGRHWDIYRKCMPDIARAYDELPMEIFKDGVLSGKMKRLMALVGALVRGCKACILFQTEKALLLKATAEEILEGCAVAISLSGTMVAGETTRVVQLLEEKGLLENLKKDD